MASLTSVSLVDGQVEKANYVELIESNNEKIHNCEKNNAPELISNTPVQEAQKSPLTPQKQETGYVTEADVDKLVLGCMKLINAKKIEQARNAFCRLNLYHRQAKIKVARVTIYSYYLLFNMMLVSPQHRRDCTS